MLSSDTASSPVIKQTSLTSAQHRTLSSHSSTPINHDHILSAFNFPALQPKFRLLHSSHDSISDPVFYNDTPSPTVTPLQHTHCQTESASHIITTRLQQIDFHCPIIASSTSTSASTSIHFSLYQIFSRTSSICRGKGLLLLLLFAFIIAYYCSLSYFLCHRDIRNMDLPLIKSTLNKLFLFMA